MVIVLVMRTGLVIVWIQIGRRDMTAKENNPDQYGTSDVTAMQCQDDWAVPPPFHNEECSCDGTGSIIGDKWDPKLCKCMLIE